MYLNASRFDSRTNPKDSNVEMNDQDHTKWDQNLIGQGIGYLNEATNENRISIYLILATISANHCVAPSLDKTNWSEILALYNALLDLDDSSIIKLSRSVALAKVEGSRAAISELEVLQ
jgi:RNA polymerase sigma-70 factor (ECF subfamily)